MPTWFAPSDTWPRHGEPHWRRALERVQRAGWHLEKYDGHNWGKVVCDPNIEAPCKKLIFRTGEGSETVALEVERMIERCHHVVARNAEASLDQVESALNKADKLITAANACLAFEREAADIDDLLAAAVAAVDDAEATLRGHALGEAERQHAESGNELVVGAETLGIDWSQATVADAYVVEATVQVDHADAVLADVPHVADLSATIERQRHRIQAIRTKLIEISH